MGTKVIIFSKSCLVICTFSLSQLSFSQTLSEWQYNQKEAASYFSGLENVQLSGWGGLENKVDPVIAQLVEYSGESYKVIGVQTNQWGLAYAGGYILFDISSAASSKPILAFRLAHEWGHQVLGHQPNLYHPDGGGWKYRVNSAATEDAADNYAGHFLAKYGYSLDEVVAELNSMPVSNDKSHSDGKSRAKTVANAYHNTVEVTATNPLCVFLARGLSSDSALIKKIISKPSGVLAGFSCEIRGDSAAITCAKFYDEDQEASKAMTDLSSSIKQCLPPTFKYSKAHIWQSWTRSETMQNVTISSNGDDVNIAVSVDEKAIAK